MNNYWLLDRPIAHRGYHKKEDNIPENSLPAFQRAIDHNFNIELDVQLTKDGKVVVFHDHNVKRMCGVDKAVEKFTYDEFSKLKLDGHDDIHPPLLQDVLDLVDGKVGIVIEIKSMNYSPFFKLERELNKIMKGYNGLYCVKSFSPLSVIWYFNHNNKVLRGFLTGFKQDFLNIMGVVAYPFSMFCSFNVEVLPQKRVDKKFRGKNKPIICWTVNSEEKIETVKKYADNIVFERLESEVVEAYYEFNKTVKKDYKNFKV